MPPVSPVSTAAPNVTRLRAVPAAPQENIVMDAIRALRRHRELTLAVFLLGLVPTLLFALTREPVFTAEASLRVENRESRMSRLQSETDKLLTGNISDITVVRTEVEILQSPVLLRRVAEAVGPQPAATPGPIARIAALAKGLIAGGDAAEVPGEADADKAAETASAIASRLTVDTAGNSFLIKLSYGDRDPQRAAAVLSTLVGLYVADQRASKEQITTSGESWLKAEVEERRQALLRSQQEAARFRDENRLGELNGITTLGQEIAEATRALGEANNRAQQLQAELQELEGARRDPMSRTGAARILESRIIQQLLEQDNELAREEAEKSMTLGPQHPVMRELESRRKSMQDRIAREVDAIAKATGRQLAAARGEVAGLRDRLADLNQRQVQLSGASAKLRDLEEVAEASRSVYNDFLREYRQTAARNRVQAADVTVVAEPAVPTRGRTGKALILAGGTIASAGIAVLATLLLFWMRGGVVDARTLSMRIGLRNLGMLPELTPRDRDAFLAGETRVSMPLVNAALGILHALPNGFGKHRQVLAVTSAVPEEGKTFTAVALARVLALSGHRTLLIDLDGRGPSIEVSVAGDLEDRATVVGSQFTLGGLVLARSRTPNLTYVFPDAGGAKNILSAEELHKLFLAARHQFDAVIVDCPPVLLASESIAIARLADVAVLAVRWERTRTATVAEAASLLREADVAIDGFVLSRLNLHKHTRYGLHDRGAAAGRYADRYPASGSSLIAS